MFTLFEWLLARIRNASEWLGSTWKAFTDNPFKRWRADVQVIGEVAKAPKGPRVDVHVMSLKDGVILTLAGFDVRGERTVQIGAHMGAREYLDAIVASLLEARNRTWP